jgi:hypothetical protein
MREDEEQDMTDEENEKKEKIPEFSAKRPFLAIAKGGKDRYYSDDDDSANYDSSQNSDDDFQMGQR